MNTIDFYAGSGFTAHSACKASIRGVRVERVAHGLLPPQSRSKVSDNQSCWGICREVLVSALAIPLVCQRGDWTGEYT